MDGQHAQGAPTSTQPPWALPLPERDEHSPSIRSNILCFAIDLESEYLHLGPLPASLADSPRYDGRKDGFPSDSKTKLGADSIKKRNRWQPLGYLLGTSNINYGLLVIDKIARNRSHTPLLQEPLFLHTDTAEAGLKFLGDQVLSTQQLQQVRLFHLSLMWLLHGNPTLADPDMPRFRTFCESQPLNLLVVPLSAAASLPSTLTPHVLETGQVHYNSDERTFVDFRMLTCFLATHSAAPYNKAAHRPGAIVRTSYSPAIYTFIDRLPGEGLNTQISLSNARDLKPSQASSEHQNLALHAQPLPLPSSLADHRYYPGNEPFAHNMAHQEAMTQREDDSPLHTTVGEYLRERWELDPEETDSLILANPVILRINIAQDSFPTASKWVLPVSGVIDSPSSLSESKTSSSDKIGRKLHPNHTQVLPVSLLDLNRASYMPAIMCAVQRRLSSLNLHFDICMYPYHKNAQTVPTATQEAASDPFSSHAPPDFGSVSSLSNLQKLDSMRSFRLDLLSPPDFIATMEEALTLPAASESHNYERLETLGDTVLKFWISTSLFITMPGAGEGAMSEAKIRLISNKFLAKATHTHWIESYSFQNQLGVDLKKTRPRQPLQMKTRADLVEAVLGHFFINYDENGARNFLAWLDDDYFELARKVNDVKSQGELAHYARAPLGWFLPSSSRTSSSHSSPLSQRSSSSEPAGELIDSIVDAYSSMPLSVTPNPLFLDDDFANLPRLKYRFRHKHLLATALTHTSAKPRPTGQTFERFEFLGDACLDLMFLCNMFMREKLTPGEMSVHRSQIAGNCNYAFLAVLLGFHTRLIYDSVEISREIRMYIDRLKNLARDVEVQGSYDEPELAVLIGNPEVLRIHFPAALSDLFEAIAGAVFIDLDFNLLAFRNVWLPVCGPVVAAQFQRNLHARELPQPHFELSHLMLQKRCKDLQTIRENGILSAVWHGHVLAKTPDTKSRNDSVLLDQETLKVLNAQPWLWQEHCNCMRATPLPNPS